jgi:hypothetical protein
MEPVLISVIAVPSPGITGDSEFSVLAPESSVSVMAENHPLPAPPTCPECRKAMHFIVLKSGRRTFQCVRCDDVDPMRLSDVHAWMKGELQPPRLR